MLISPFCPILKYDIKCTYLYLQESHGPAIAVGTLYSEEEVHPGQLLQHMKQLKQ